MHLKGKRSKVELNFAKILKQNSFEESNPPTTHADSYFRAMVGILNSLQDVNIIFFFFVVHVFFLFIFLFYLRKLCVQIKYLFLMQRKKGKRENCINTVETYACLYCICMRKDVRTFRLENYVNKFVIYPDSRIRLSQKLDLYQYSSPKNVQH